jgi:hypothetical protein
MDKPTTTEQGSQEERYCTYAAFDPNIQKYIYVGVTSNITRRIKEHAHQSLWWRPDLRFDELRSDMGRPQALVDEKHWIQYYADRGHPLENQKNKMDMTLERVELKYLLGDDIPEEVFQIFFRGRDFMFKREQEDIIWRNTPAWDQLFSAIRDVIAELAHTHPISLSVLDIARLVAKVVGLEMDDDEVTP